MNNDNFTKAARAEAEKTWPKQRHGVHVNPSLIRDEMVRMAVWARAYLAAQEPTDAECLVAKAEALRDAAEYIDGAEPHHLGDSDLDPLDYNTLGEYGIDRAAEWLRARAADIEKDTP